MYAVVTTLTFNDRSAAEAELSGIVSRVSGMRGFVGGYWVALGADRGISVIAFDSQEAAQALATFAKGALTRPWPLRQFKWAKSWRTPNAQIERLGPPATGRPTAAPQPTSRQSPSSRQRTQIRSRHAMTLRVEDCRAAHRILSQRGAQFLTPPVETEREVRPFFRVPDGHLLEFSEAKS